MGENSFERRQKISNWFDYHQDKEEFVRCYWILDTIINIIDMSRVHLLFAKFFKFA